MNVAIFSTKKYDRDFLGAANGSRHELRFFEPHLNEETVGLATGFEAVCVFVNDQVNAAVIAKLRSLGVRLIALRCAGYNNVDLSAACSHRPVAGLSMCVLSQIEDGPQGRGYNWLERFNRAGAKQAQAAENYDEWPFATDHPATPFLSGYVSCRQRPMIQT